MTRHHSTDAPTMMPSAHGWTTADYVRNIDPFLVGAVVLLVGLGTVLVYSASAVRADALGAGTSHFLIRHTVAVVLGLSIMSVTVRVPVDAWARLALPLLIVTAVLLVCVFVPGLGRSANGAQRWLSLGPLSIQPAEVAKLSVAVYLANVLAKKRERVSDFSAGFLPPVAIVSALSFLVLLQPDFGTAAVIAGMLGVMLFVAGTRIAYLVFAAAAMVPVALHYVITRSHARARIAAFLDPESYRAGIGYQAWESLVSIGSGGVWGLGLGHGNQHLFFLPESHTDFIFAVVGQELGFVGVCVLVATYAVLIGRTMIVARGLPCRFPMFLVCGIAVWLGLQAFTHMSVSLALLPTKGLTLPLVSFGRSSLVVTLAAIGIVLRASAEQRAYVTGVSPRRRKR